MSAEGIDLDHSGARDDCGCGKESAFAGKADIDQPLLTNPDL
jgi:hypothetical protein